jgi:hypothetical protein
MTDGLLQLNGVESDLDDFVGPEGARVVHQGPLGTPDVGQVDAPRFLSRLVGEEDGNLLPSPGLLPAEETGPIVVCPILVRVTGKGMGPRLSERRTFIVLVGPLSKCLSVKVAGLIDMDQEKTDVE